MMIDLRSDTVTRPTREMRAVMAAALVGDDVYGEDPEVNRLQETMAKLFGKEAGLFVPTGTMSNQLAIKAHTAPGEEVIVEYDCHSFQYETGAPSVIAQVQLHTLKGTRGVLDPAEVVAAIRPPAYYYPRTALVCVENTHNKAGGCVYPIERLIELRAALGPHNIPLHLDGARIWNAHIASGTPLAAFGAEVDSISICFSKGLGAPVGSMLLGTKEFIVKAHKYRKMYGGGMRQAGVLAAAAQYAVEHHVARLRMDHEHARYFAKELAACPAFTIDLDRVQTNMVMMDFRASSITADEAQQRAQAQGVLIGQAAPGILRAVFHLDVSPDNVVQAVQAFLALGKQS
jgi:threonine aldolase